MSDQLSSITADIIDRLSRIEANLTQMKKTVEGNGTPGLVQRVDSLEATNDAREGASAVKTKFMAIAMTLVVALLSAALTLNIQRNNREIAEHDAAIVYLHHQDDRIQSMEISIAVLLQGLKGDTGAKGSVGTTGKPGTKGKTGTQGTQGVQGSKGDKGGVKLFGK